jgi:hypothetical protein
MLARDAGRGGRDVGISVDKTREEDEVAKEEEDNREGLGGGQRTRHGRFGGWPLYFLCS